MKFPFRTKSSRSSPQKNHLDFQTDDQGINEALQTPAGMLALLGVLEEFHKETLQKTTDPHEAIEELLGALRMVWLLIKTLDKSLDEERPLKQVISFRAHTALWCLCQDLRSLCQKSPPSIDWFSDLFADLSEYSYISLIMLENLSEVWGAYEFAVVKKQFERLCQEEPVNVRKILEDGSSEGYLESDVFGFPVSTDFIVQFFEERLEEKISFFLDLLILFQGDVKTFLFKRFGQKTPTTEEITLLGEQLIGCGLIRSAQTCLRSISTPKLCQERLRWHETYNLVLRYTGQDQKALDLRWEYLLAVKAYPAVHLYLAPLVETLNPTSKDNEEEVSAQYREHSAKVSEVIIHQFPIETAINTSLRLKRSPDFENLLHDLMLHHYNGGELSRCSTQTLKKLAYELKDDLESLSGEKKTLLLTALISYRALIQKQWRTEDQMSAKKSQKLHEFINQAQNMDAKLKRTAVTQHIPSHQEFLDHLTAKHRPKVSPTHAAQGPSSSPRPTSQEKSVHL